MLLVFVRISSMRQLSEQGHDLHFNGRGRIISDKEKGVAIIFFPYINL